MKIVWWIDHLGLGGSQKNLSQLVRGISKNTDFDQAVVCLNNNVNLETLKSIQGAGIEVRILGKWSIVTMVGLIKTMVWLRQNRFDVSVTILFFSDVIGTLLSCMVGIKKRISSQRGSNQDYRPWQEWCVGQTLKLAHLVIVNSNNVKQSLKRYLPSGIAVETVVNGIEVVNIGKSPVYSLRRELNLADDVILIGYVGRLVAGDKGLNTLISAVAQLKRENVRLILTGTGKERSRLEIQAELAGITSKVHFLGYRTDILEILCQLNIYVQVSTFEGMSNSLMEAMAVGCPIIASAVDGNKELIRNGQDGWLVKHSESEVLASTIKMVLNNSTEAVAKGDSAKRRVVNKFPEKKMINSWKSIFCDSSH